jgi:hypothetical protein
MTIVLEPLYRFKEICIKMPVTFSTKIEKKTNVKFIRNHKRSRVVKGILWVGEGGGTTIDDFKTYYREDPRWQIGCGSRQCELRDSKTLFRFWSHTSGIKHQWESKLRHPEPLTHGKLLYAMLHWEKLWAAIATTGSKSACETFGKPKGEHHTSCGIPQPPLG